MKRKGRTNNYNCQMLIKNRVIIFLFLEQSIGTKSYPTKIFLILLKNKLKFQTIISYNLFFNRKKMVFNQL